jgi:flagellar biosynthetic protein FliQ
MTPETVIGILRGAIEMGALVAGPILLIDLLAGVMVSVFQAATQINDQSLVFIPKIIATLLTLVLFGPWMLQKYIDFVRQTLLSLPTFIG